MPPPMANAVGGRTARACDHCIRHRARWYCAADDAFLCQPCDASVHSANTLAGRHHRLRLTAPTSLTPPPSWPRKPRTPRGQTQKPVASQKLGTLVVPDLDESIVEEEVEQLLYQVPVFDPFLGELSPPPVLMNENEKITFTANSPSVPKNNLYLPPSVELDEFDTADMESLLGTGFDEEQFCIEGALGLVEKREEDLASCLLDDGGDVKLEFEGEEAIGVDMYGVKMEFERETLDINFDYESPVTQEEVDSERASLSLKLNYENVIVAWDGQGCSPWMDGRRPDQDVDIWWPDYTGMINVGGAGEAGAVYGGVAQLTTAGDLGREARVSRYREKRRTRLFSKKIRYEVRKLNAEKRPRMKGRFVKRSSFPPAGGGGALPY